LNVNTLASEYGYAASFLNSVPELKSLFKTAVAQTWTPAEFTAKLQATKWFQGASVAVRNGQLQKSSDPATWAQNVAEVTATIQQQAGSMGAQMSSSVEQQMASDAVMHGWTPAQLQQQMASYVTTMGSTGHFAGQAGTNEQTLQKLASDYGQTMSDPSLKSWVQKIAAGSATSEDYQAQLKASAASLYPQYAKQINAGSTLNDIAQPYIQQMATTLEMDPNTITVADKHIQSALNGQPSGTGGSAAANPNPQGMNMYDFTNMLRQDPSWATTKNAQDAAGTASRSILQSFGFSF
jgi:hypothetical protein